MTITFNEACSKLDVILENAIINYEVEVLTEGTKESIKRVGGIVVAGILKFIKLVKDFVLNLINKIKSKKIKDADYVPTTSEDAIKPDVLQKKINKHVPALCNILSGKKDAAINDDEFNVDVAVKEIGAEGTVSVDVLNRNLVTINKTVTTLESAAKGMKLAGDADSDISKVNKFVRYLKEVAANINNLITLAIAKLGVGKDKTKNESAGLTAKQKMAKLLIEAAAIIGDEFDEKDPEILQDPIDDIPEEKSIIGSEQDPGVSGGAGEKIDLEEIKDLVGDDKEAIGLLIDDDSICESVTIDFGI